MYRQFKEKMPHLIEGLQKLFKESSQLQELITVDLEGLL